MEITQKQDINSIMKLRNLFYLLLALPLVFAACENGSEGTDKKPDTPEVAAPILTLTSDATMEFTAEGGAGEIVYTLENPKEGVAVIATCAAEWVTDMAVSDKVAFVVAANEGEARQTKVVVSYEEQKFEVAIDQAAKVQDDNPNEPDEPEDVVEGWAVVGTMTNSWDVSQAIAMETIDGYYVIYGFEVEASDRFYFIYDGDFNNTRTGDGVAAEVDHGYLAHSAGGDIRVSESGKYDLYLSDDLAMYYLMSVGTDPRTATAPEVPVPNTWSVLGNFEGNNFAEDVSMGRWSILYVAEDVVFAEDGDAAFRIRKGLSDRDEHNYGARTKKVREVGEEIFVFSAANKGSNNVVVNVERGVKYDIYFLLSTQSVWVMPDGQKPEIEIVWEKVEGVMWSATNFGVFMYSQTHNLFFDFNCAVASEDDTIPEGTYYINDVNNTGNNFNDFGKYTLFTIGGVDYMPIDGTLEIKHISGGYDITVDMVASIHGEVKAHYAGAIVGNQYMGGYVTNPE